MSYVFKKSLLILSIAVGFSLVACDDDGGDSGGTDTMSGADATSGGDTTSPTDTTSPSDTTEPGTGGQTQCGPDPSFSVTCQAGQYCANQDLRDCQNGCLSNQNCASDQTCIIPTGESVGACQNNTNPTPTGATRDEFCGRLQACDPANYSDAFCDNFYAGTNAECHNCIAGANCANALDVCASACGFE